MYIFLVFIQSFPRNRNFFTLPAFKLYKTIPCLLKLYNTLSVLLHIKQWKLKIFLCLCSLCFPIFPTTFKDSSMFSSCIFFLCSFKVLLKSDFIHITYIQIIQKSHNLTNVTLASDDDKRRRSQSWHKGGGMFLVNTVQQLTNVSNVTLACDDDKRRRSQSCYKAGGMELVNTVQ